MKYKEVALEQKKLKNYEGIKRNLLKKQIRYDLLEKAYFYLSRKLNSEQPRRVTRTWYERYMFTELSTVSAKVYPSFWIMNFNLDIFLPELGAVVELDGSIHNNEVKALKDNYRDDRLLELGIPVFHIENVDTKRMAVHIKGLLSNPKKHKPADVQKQLLKSIYIETIVTHFHHEVVQGFFREGYFDNYLYPVTKPESTKVVLSECQRRPDESIAKHLVDGSFDNYGPDVVVVKEKVVA